MNFDLNIADSRLEFLRKFSYQNNLSLVSPTISNKKLPISSLEEYFYDLLTSDNRINIEEIFNSYPITYKKNFDKFVKLEQQILSFFSSIFEYKSVEFPVNLRAVHSKISSEYLNKVYATDKLHSDIWSNEPFDILNTLIYIGGDLNTYCNFKYVDVDKLSDLLNTRYKNNYIEEGFNSLQDLNFTASPGDMLIFDSFVPHNTVRSNTPFKGRFSIDFRFKLFDPYLLYDQYSFEEIPINLLKYWYIPPENVLNFNDRIEYELNQIQLFHGKGNAYNYRIKSLKLNYV